MAARKDLMLKKHRKIRAEFARLRDLKKYRYSHILTMLEEKFDLSEYRIERIIAMDDNNQIYANKNQTKLFE